MDMFKVEKVVNFHKIQEPEDTGTVAAIFRMDPSLQSSG